MFKLVGVGKGFGMGIWKKSNPHSYVLDFNLSFVECVMTMRITFNNNAVFNFAYSYTHVEFGAIGTNNIGTFKRLRRITSTKAEYKIHMKTFHKSLVVLTPKNSKGSDEIIE